MHTKNIVWFGQPALLACDGHCSKAWGLSCRPKVKFDPKDADDYAYLADSELGEAPADPRTYEGRDAKPEGPHEMNKWCSRECERSVLCADGQAILLPDYSQRVYNMPSRHPEAVAPVTR